MWVAAPVEATTLAVVVVDAIVEVAEIIVEVEVIVAVEVEVEIIKDVVGTTVETTATTLELFAGSVAWMPTTKAPMRRERAFLTYMMPVGRGPICGSRLK